MASLRQLEANRRNSLRSTEGKAVSRFNALKSGINAQAQVIPGEDPADLQAMADGYTQDWAPKTYLERFLVDSLVRADWLLRRLSRVEAEIWTHEMEGYRGFTFSKLDEKSPIGDVYSRSTDAFTRLQRRIDSTERSYYRALTQLQRLRQGLDDSDGPAPDLPPTPEPAPDCKNEANSTPVEHAILPVAGAGAPAPSQSNVFSRSVIRAVSASGSGSNRYCAASGSMERTSASV